MSADFLSEALYRLGQVARSEGPGADSLRAIARIGADATRADILGVGVFEDGIGGRPLATCILGPWDEDLSARFHRQSEWSIEDRVLAQRLARFERDRLYRRAELIDEPEFCRSRLFNEFQRPLGMGDQALGVYRRPDGLELLISLSAASDRGPIPDATLQAARALAPYMARAWAASWRREPAWIAELRPHTRGVLDHLLAGYDDAQIATMTGLTYHSVRAHLKRLFRRAGVRSRLHLMQVCRGERPAPRDARPEP